MHFLALTSLVTLSAALQFPSWLPFVHSVDPQSVLNLPIQTQVLDRVAIIGAGAAGSSAAFWIGKANERYGLDIQVDVYEKSNKIGGRKYAAAVSIIFNVTRMDLSTFGDAGQI